MTPKIPNDDLYITIPARPRWWRVRLYRARRKLESLICRMRRRHIVTREEWGYSPTERMVDLYCPNCGAVVRRLPVDDYDDIETVMNTMQWAKAVTDETPATE